MGHHSLKYPEHSSKEIVEFIVKYMPWFHREELLPVIEKHMEYKTCLITADHNGIVSVSTWNIKGDQAHIMLTCIRPSHRRKRFLRYLIAKGHSMFPDVNFILWERDQKTNKQFSYDIKKLLRRY